MYAQTHAFCVRFRCIRTQTHYLPHCWFSKRPLFIFSTLNSASSNRLGYVLGTRMQFHLKCKIALFFRQVKEVFTWPAKEAVRRPSPPWSRGHLQVPHSLPSTCSHTPSGGPFFSQARLALISGLRVLQRSNAGHFIHVRSHKRHGKVYNDTKHSISCRSRRGSCFDANTLCKKV